jgi:hypothetical protein
MKAQLVIEAREQARRAAIRTAINGHCDTLEETVEALRALATQNDSLDASRRIRSAINNIYLAVVDLTMVAR